MTLGPARGKRWLARRSSIRNSASTLVYALYVMPPDPQHEGLSAPVHIRRCPLTTQAHICMVGLRPVSGHGQRTVPVWGLYGTSSSRIKHEGIWYAPSTKRWTMARVWPSATDQFTAGHDGLQGSACEFIHLESYRQHDYHPHRSHGDATTQWPGPRRWW